MRRWLPVILFVLPIVIFGAFYVIVSNNEERLDKGQVNGCIRLNLKRVSDNGNFYENYLGFRHASQASDDPYYLRHSSRRYSPPTHCLRANSHPETFLPQPGIPFTRLASPARQLERDEALARAQCRYWLDHLPRRSRIRVMRKNPNHCELKP